MTSSWTAPSYAISVLIFVLLNLPLCGAWASKNLVVVVVPRALSPLSWSSTHKNIIATETALHAAPSDIEYIKTELIQYLQKRKEVGADELAQQEVGKVIGGTKGNAVLEFVSGAPNKERVVDKAPNALDYDELIKYGYGHLVTPIMNFGGRFAMYRLLDMEAPETASALRRVSSPEIVIDRTGELTNPKRYSGLKLGQVIDDSVQEEALRKALMARNYMAGATTTTADNSNAPMPPKSLNDEYEMPFSDRRNVSPKQTPDWTPERLDEWGKSQGRVQAWARRAKAGEFVSDPKESLDDWTLQQRAFSILTALLAATAFGQSTDAFLVDLTQLVSSADEAMRLKEALQAPALGLLIASLGSLVVSYLQSKQKNRNTWIWSVKGLLGGPFTVAILRTLDPLLTRAAQEERLQK